LQKPDSSRYIFSTYAHAIGAALHKPSKAFLTDGPTATLPVSGGLLSHAKESISFMHESSEILRLRHASASAHGERRENQFVSIATAKVEKLDILGVVKADAIVSRVTAVFPADGDSQQDQDLHPAKFYVSGSHFVNLRIDGKLIEFPPDPPEREQGFQVPKSEAQIESIYHGESSEIHIPEFGSVYLGEKVTYSSKVILTMLRVELACSHGGTITACGTCTNGTNGLSKPGH
jgi:hypothetical protein